VPAQWDDDEKQRAMSEIAQLASESVVRCPVDSEGKGFDIELVEPKNNSHDAFASIMAKADTAIAVVLLGQNLTTEISERGSRAAAQVHDRVRQDVIRSDAESLSDCLHDQYMIEWAAYNHGEPELAPWPVWDIVPPQDEQKAGTALRALMEAFLLARQSKIPFDYVKMSEGYGLPLLPGKEIPEYTEPTVDVAKIKSESQADEEGGGGGSDAGDDGAAEKKSRSAKGPSARVALPAGALRGQIYSSGIADSLRAKAAPLLSPYLKKVLAAIDGAKGYEEIRQRVLDAFKAEKTPRDLARALEDAMRLCEMNGLLSVEEDSEE
jgi:phage gp29-like protein